MTSTIRLVLAATLLSGWLVALLVGWALGGAIHLALVVGLALVPWRQAGRVDELPEAHPGARVSDPVDPAAGPKS